MRCRDIAVTRYFELLFIKSAKFCSVLSRALTSTGLRLLDSLGSSGHCCTAIGVGLWQAVSNITHSKGRHGLLIAAIDAFDFGIGFVSGIVIALSPCFFGCPLCD